MILKRLAPVVVLLALVAAGCGGKDDPAVDAAAGGAHNSADVEFAQGMISHHEQAVEMADLALAKATDPKVKDLADRIKAAQVPEITTLKGWLTSWGEDVKAGGGMGGMAGMGDSAMMTTQEMGQLEAAAAADLDRLFLTMMVKHHRGAIGMAKTEGAKGTYLPAKSLATQITTSQTAEIDEMEGLLAAAK